ncbi:MAG TPA: hydantoinase B/oxoprolinase family protein [Dehalococcoidia bacterium]|nr:hydantoinase B/oxoprolinase family protein [Dehalococcoidia bacterium]
MSSPDLSIFSALFRSVAEEMGTSYYLSSFSPNIKERQDYSCGLFDEQGHMAAMAPHIPLHLGSMPAAVASVLPLAPFEPGDVVILNDPYLSGTHLPDVTMVAPVFVGGSYEPAFFTASRGHQADIGGSSPGSMGAAQELFQEGLIVPPVRFFRAGELVEDVRDLILANVRTPEERWGDLRAQAAAHAIGQQRLLELTERFGLATCQERMAELMDYTERMTRLAIQRIPDGEYDFEDLLDDDGFGTERIRVAVRISVRADEMEVDFADSAPLVRGSLNATTAVSASAVHYVVRCLLPRDVPANEGSTRPIRIVLPEGSIVHAERPHAVAGSIETAQRIVDVLTGALAKALPEEMPAACYGSMNNILFGGWDALRDVPFNYYETVGGGHGGSPNGPGAPAMQAHMTNTLNTPVEVLEMAYPLRVLEYAIREGSGGAGKHPGGEGTIRTIQALTDCTVSLLGERRTTQPWGTQGGAAGAPARNTLVQNGEEQTVPSKDTRPIQAGDVVRMETAGGGGWGEVGS